MDTPINITLLCDADRITVYKLAEKVRRETTVGELQEMYEVFVLNRMLCGEGIN